MNFLVFWCIRIMFTLLCSLLSVHAIMSKKVHTLINNALLLKIANHHLSLQQVIIFAIVASKTSGHKSP